MSERQGNELTALRQRIEELERRLEEPETAARPVSRRRLLGMAGAAAAGAAGATLAAAAPAGASTGNLVYGSTANDAATDDTALTSSNNGKTLAITCTGANGNAIEAQANGTASATYGVYAGSSSSTGAGVYGHGSGVGILASGTVANMKLLGLGTGAPTTGAHEGGEFRLDTNHVLFQCIADGTPGTWIRQAPLVVLPTPVRVYNSASSGGPLGSNQERDVQITGTFSSVTIPSGISAVLTNLACNNPSAAGFLAMFKDGTTWPGTSNLNFAAHQTTSNNATSAVSAGGKVTVRCGGATTNFVVDVFGYYP